MTFIHVNTYMYLWFSVLLVIVRAPHVHKEVDYDCPDTWENAPASVETEVCYKVLDPAATTYRDAINRCQYEHANATLAMPKTDGQFKTVLKRIGSDTEVWIGLDDRNAEGIFVWNDGELLSGYPFSLVDTLHDDDSHDHNCVSLILHTGTHSHAADDLRCTADKSVICQILISDFFEEVTSGPGPVTTDSQEVTSVQTIVTTEIREQHCCHCTVISEEELQLSLLKMRQALSVNKRELSGEMRRKNCAEDKRLSSQMIGWSGALILVAMTSYIIFMDSLSLYLALKKSQ